MNASRALALALLLPVAPLAAQEAPWLLLPGEVPAPALAGDSEPGPDAGPDASVDEGPATAAPPEAATQLQAAPVAWTAPRPATVPRAPAAGWGAPAWGWGAPAYGWGAPAWGWAGWGVPLRYRWGPQWSFGFSFGWGAGWGAGWGWAPGFVVLPPLFVVGWGWPSYAWWPGDGRWGWPGHGYWVGHGGWGWRAPPRRNDGWRGVIPPDGPPAAYRPRREAIAPSPDVAPGVVATRPRPTASAMRPVDRRPAPAVAGAVEGVAGAPLPGRVATAPRQDMPLAPVPRTEMARVEAQRADPPRGAEPPSRRVDSGPDRAATGPVRED